MQLVVMFLVDVTFAVANGSWLSENQPVKWTNSKTFAVYKRMLLSGDYVPDSITLYEFVEKCHCGKNDVVAHLGRRPEGNNELPGAFLVAVWVRNNSRRSRDFDTFLAKVSYQMEVCYKFFQCKFRVLG